MNNIEINEGYAIVAAEFYEHEDGEEHAVVLGHMWTRLGAQYVTWERTRPLANPDACSYFWGHYFDNDTAARRDYHERLMVHYANRLPNPNEGC